MDWAQSGSPLTADLRRVGQADGTSPYRKDPSGSETKFLLSERLAVARYSIHVPEVVRQSEEDAITATHKPRVPIAIFSAVVCCEAG